MQLVEMAVHMDCPGCETKIKKALRKLKGINHNKEKAVLHSKTYIFVVIASSNS